MKKTYIALAAALTAVTAMAQEPMASPVMRAGGPENSGDYVIWEPPTEGTYTMDFEVGMRGISLLGATYTKIDMPNGMKGKICSTTDGTKAWIQNPLPTAGLTSWVEGEYDADGNITVKLPQWLNANVAGNTGACLTLAKREDNGIGEYYVPVDEADGVPNQITYVINSDETVTMKTPEGYALIPTMRYLDEVGLGPWWSQYAALYETDYTDHEGQVLKVDGDFENWMMVYQNNIGTQSGDVGFLEKDGKVYLRGINPVYPDACIEGVIDGDEVTFQGGQFIGETDLHYEYMTFFGTQFGENQFGQKVWLFDETPMQSVTLAYDRDEKLLEGPMDVAWLTNAGTGTTYYSAFVTGPSFKWGDTSKALTPQDPIIEEDALYFFIPEMGFGQVFFQLPPFATDNTPLDKANMSWVLYLDGEPFAFTPDEYAVDEEMVEVPWDYDNGEDIVVEKNGAHGCIWYIDGLASVGVQSLNTVNGDTARSNIVTRYNPDTGVTAITPDQARTVEYYDLQGRRVANPENGIFIQRITTEAGKALVSKVKK